MACEFDPRELSAFLDGEVAPDRAAAWREHLAACLACREAERSMRECDASVRAALPSPPATLRARLAEAARSRFPRRRAVFRRAAAILAFGGAGAALAAWAFFPREARAHPLALYAGQQAWIDALELEAASLRLELESETIAPEDRDRLEGAIREALARLQRVRTESRALVAWVSPTENDSPKQTERTR